MESVESQPQARTGSPAPSGEPLRPEPAQWQPLDGEAPKGQDLPVEALLRRERALSEAVFDSLDALVVVLDARGGIVRLNRAAEEATGYPLAEARGKPLWELVLPAEAIEGARDLLARLTSGRDDRNKYECDCVMRDGSRRRIAWTNAAVTRANGAVEQVVCTGLDVTDRRQAENGLEESEEKLQALFDLLPVGISVLDAKGSILKVNPAMERSSALSREGLLKGAYRARTYLHPDRSVMAPAEFPSSRTRRDRQSVQDSEVGIVTQDGEVSWTSVSAVPVSLGDWDVVVVAADITARKQALDDLRQALDEGERRQQHMSALLDASRTILERNSFHDAAQAIHRVCKEATGAEAGYVALLSDDGTLNEVLFLDAGGRPCSVDPSLPMPIRGLREVAYRTGKAVFLNEFQDSDWTLFLPEGHVEVQNVAFAPLMLDGQAVGLLGLANKPGGFDDHDLRLVSAFGELATVALQNSRLLESVQDSEQRFRSVVETASDAIVAVDSQARIIFWNRMAEEMFGYPQVR